VVKVWVPAIIARCICMQPSKTTISQRQAQVNITRVAFCVGISVTLCNDATFPSRQLHCHTHRAVAYAQTVTIPCVNSTGWPVGRHEVKRKARAILFGARESNPGLTRDLARNRRRHSACKLTPRQLGCLIRLDTAPLLLPLLHSSTTHPPLPSHRHPNSTSTSTIPPTPPSPFAHRLTVTARVQQHPPLRRA